MRMWTRKSFSVSEMVVGVLDHGLEHGAARAGCYLEPVFGGGDGVANESMMLGTGEREGLLARR